MTLFYSSVTTAKLNSFTVNCDMSKCLLSLVMPQANLWFHARTCSRGTRAKCHQRLQMHACSVEGCSSKCTDILQNGHMGISASSLSYIIISVNLGRGDPLGCRNENLILFLRLVWNSWLSNCMHLKVSSYWKLVFWDWRWLTVHRGALCFTLRNASGWALIVIVVRGAGCYSKIVQATSFKKPSPGEAITDLLVFIISPMKHLQLCYGDVLLWDSSMGNIGVNVSLETCSNDSNRTVCYLQLCYLACTKNRAINSLINCIIVTFYPCAILH